jgi:hypothetical protein
LYTGGHPHISGTWRYDQRHKTVFLDIELTQNGNYSVPLDLTIDSEAETCVIEPGKQTFRFHSNKKPEKIILDPGSWLLFEGEISQK